MLIDGHEFTEGPERNLVRIAEVGPTKSGDAMDAFTTWFPPDAPEWDKFVVKHTAMQQREFDVARRKYARMRLPEHLRLEIYGCN